MIWGRHVEAEDGEGQGVETADRRVERMHGEMCRWKCHDSRFGHMMS